MTRIKCLHCGTENDPLGTFGYCKDCGQQLPALSTYTAVPTGLSGVEKSPPRDFELFDYPEVKGQTKVSTEMRWARHQTASTLFGIAMIHLVCGAAGFVYLNVLDQDNTRREPLHLMALFEVVGVTVLFALLGVWAMLQPLLPAIIGLLLYLPYVSFSILAAVAHPYRPDDEGILILLLVKVLLILALGKTTYSAVRATLSANRQ